MASIENFTGTLSGIAVGPDGTTVAIGTFSGALSWGRSSVAASAGTAGFIAVARGDGAPRWARLVNDGLLPQGVAMDDDGDVAVVARGSDCAPSKVALYDPDGSRRWARDVPTWCVGGRPYERPVVAMRGHDVVIGGTFTDTFDFGDGPASAIGTDGFVIDLAP
ncbi:hypothetical protein AMPC_35510 [Anaeromyxobacter paludicola]|uniref:Uncharacterized protein n=1 Tax=Anaeromyxobacter paludicola TaxID=2918171 RepID=A0ABM7XEW4_9BACT|nr:hypothetical protein AMPC_35510 [Anaeromyxobacter paludicola]